MDSLEAGKTLATVCILLFLLRPVMGLLMDAFKVMLRLAAAGLLVQVLPFDFIDKWSQGAVKWATISSQLVPVFALIALIALSTANLIFLNGTTIEQVIRIIFYVIGGVFTAGSLQWIEWEHSIRSIVKGVAGLITGVMAIFGVVLT